MISKKVIAPSNFSTNANAYQRIQGRILIPFLSLGGSTKNKAGDTQNRGEPLKNVSVVLKKSFAFDTLDLFCYP